MKTHRLQAWLLIVLTLFWSGPVSAQTVVATPLPNAKQTFLDANGNPLSGGKVFNYVPSTTVPKTTWSDTGETTPNTNPVTLDAAGRAQIWGQGNYRQIVKDDGGNTIWDAFTTAVGSAAPTGGAGQDTAPVGTVMGFSGFIVPTNWALAYGQPLNRASYSELLGAITIVNATTACVLSNTTISGLTDTSQMRVGAPIEASCLPTGTTISSITNATSIVVNHAATATGTFTSTVFPWGNGDGSLTYNIPDLRGRTMAGADAMGGTAASRLTTTYYGSSAAPPAVAGGSQSETLTTAQVPSGIVSNLQVNDTRTWGTPAAACSGTCTDTTNVAEASTGVTARQAPVAVLTGAIGATFTDNGGGLPHTVVQPTLTVNYIIKIKSNTSGAGGVTSISGMFGDVVCDSSLSCAPVGSVNTIGCAISTISQLGCVKPDGTTITVDGSGRITAISSVASSIGFGATAVTGGVSGQVLYDNAGVLGALNVTGTGNAVLSVSPTITTASLPSPTVSGTMIAPQGTWSGAGINAAAIGGGTPAPGSFTSLGASAAATLSGGGTLSGGWNWSGTITGAPTLIGSNFISLGNIAQLGSNSLLGNATGSSATMGAITLDPSLNFAGSTLRCSGFGASQSGCVPGSGGGSTTFLRADGVWAAPSGGGNVVGPGSATGDAVAVYNGTSGTLLKNSNLSYTTGNLSFAQTAAGNNTTATIDNSAVAGGYNAILQLKNSARNWWIMGGGAASGLSASGELAFFDLSNSKVRASIGPTGGFDIWNAAGAATGDFGAGAIAAQEGYFQGSRPWCDVLANGAKGDGVTDDTAAIQGCVTKLSVLTTGTIYFPPPHGGAYCTFTGVTVAAANSLIFLGTGTNGSQISTCGHNIAALSIAGSNSRIVNMQILGAGYGATSTLPVSFPAVDLTGCVQCDVENSEIHGGTNGILCGNGCGDITVYNTRISYAYSSVVNIQCSSGLCGGYFKRVKMDQDPPTGNPGPVAGSTISAWSAGATVNNGDVRIVAGTWNIQYTVGGTTGGSPPTVKPYFQNITDGSATAQLFGPATYYGLKCDTGCNQSFVEQGDILCSCYTYSVAMLNSLAGTAPTLLNIQTTNMSGYTAAINLSAGTEFVSSSNVIGSCFTTGCVGVLVASGFGPATTTLAAGIRFTDNLFFGHTYGLDLATNRTLGALFRGNEFYGMVTSALVAGNVKQFNFSDNMCGGQGQYGAANGQCYSVPVGADYYVISNNLTFGSTNPSSPANGAGSTHSTVSGNL